MTTWPAAMKAWLGARHLLWAITVALALALACREATPTPVMSPSPTPDTTSTATPIMTLTPTRVPTHTLTPTHSTTPTATDVTTHTLTPPATPTYTPLPTAVPSPTSTVVNTPAPTSTPPVTATVTATPTTGPDPRDASDRGGLWAAEVEDLLLANFVSYLAVRVTPGEDPDVDPWLFEQGFEALPTTRLVVRCAPEPVDGGWELASCTGELGPFAGATVTGFMPATGESGLEIKIRRGTFSAAVLLVRVPHREEPQASGNVGLLWHQPGGGTHSDIWASDGLVFAPRFDGRIEILDAGSGEIVGTASVVGASGGGPYVALDVKARDGYLFVATVSNGVVVFDVSRPDEPSRIAQYRVSETRGSAENFTNIHNIFLSPDGALLYAINQSFPHEEFRRRGPKTELRVLDISDPTSPVEAGRFSPGDGEGILHDINVIERDGRLIAFLNDIDDDGAFWALDVTDPAAITEMGSIGWEGIKSHSGWPFVLGDRLYFVHAEEGYDRHLTVLDVTDPTNIRIVSRFGTRPALSIHNVEVVDGIAYISYYIDGLRVVDLRDPGNPKEIGHFDTVPSEQEKDLFQGAFGVRVDGGVVYVSDIETGTYALTPGPSP